MSIQYKTKTEKEFHFINIPESYISVLELKKRLIEKEKINMKSDFSFSLLDEKCTREYKDEENVMKNIRVVYVIGPEVSGEQGILRKINDMDKRHSRKPRSATPSVPVIVHPTSFTNNIQPTQNPVFQMASSNTQAGSVHTRDDIPPPGYVCDRCYVLGHYSEFCPTLNDPDWPSKMRKWAFKESKGNPLDSLTKIDNPNNIELLLKQGNTIVRYPKNDHKGHLCMVQHKSNSNNINIAAQKIDTPAIFYCYSGKHIIEDAVILSCCSKVIGCRVHVLELASENDHRCPECKEEITMKTIHSLPILDQSIQAFVPQEKALSSLMQRVSSMPSKVSSQNEPRGDESSRHRERSRSRRSSHHDHSHHQSSHHDHSDRRSHHH